ncbi:MAG: radical SAM protein [Planctomycetota bacterium]|jgi:radical SAM protein with 4Fe4S-binding SPASM domain
MTRASKKGVRFVPPELTERRAGNVLLVWPGVPHWMIVDEQMFEFLCDMDGAAPLSEYLLTVDDPDGRSTAGRTCKDLLKLGILATTPPQRRRDKSLKTRIENVAVNLTHRCNMRCSFCYALDSLTASERNAITAAEINRFLDDVRPLASKHATLVLLGGEPLLVADKLLAVAGHARKRGFAPLVSTNGTLITPEFAHVARKVGLEVQVSLDGHCAELVDPYRGKGSFNKAVVGIRTLVESGVHTIVSMICHSGNVTDLEAYYALADSLGVSEARFIPLKRIGGADASGLTPATYRHMIHNAAQLFRDRPQFRKLAGRDALSILAGTCQLSAKRTSCGTGRQTVLLDADGSLYPCLNLNCPEHRIANVRDAGYSFRRIWESSDVLARVRRCTAIDAMAPTCQACPVRYWCLGGCRGEAFHVTGDLTAPSPHCDDLRQTVFELMWLLAETPELVGPAMSIC